MSTPGSNGRGRFFEALGQGGRSVCINVCQCQKPDRLDGEHAQDAKHRQTTPSGLTLRKGKFKCPREMEVLGQHLAEYKQRTDAHAALTLTSGAIVNGN